jgi:aldose 1-epimerase
MGSEAEIFGRWGDEQITRHVLQNDHGIRVAVLSLGAIVHTLHVPDRSGEAANVVLGYPDLSGYRGNAPYFGCVAGRYANRIEKGRFTLDGQDIQLSINDGVHHLHGGSEGFHKRNWAVVDAGAQHIALELVSPDGDQGYPGTLQATVRYSLDDENRLTIAHRATTTNATIVNLTQHSYFNLAGEGSGAVLDHELQLNASHFVPVDVSLIPTGSLAPVEGTPFDFRTAKPVVRDIRHAHSQLLAGRGYDHTFALDRPNADDRQLVDAARLLDPRSGRVLTIQTTEPGVQFYSGNFLNGTDVGTSGRAYRQGDGIALETQHFPDSPNQPLFPSATLRPGEMYGSTTTWIFAW